MSEMNRVTKHDENSSIQKRDENLGIQRGELGDHGEPNEHDKQSTIVDNTVGLYANIQNMDRCDNLDTIDSCVNGSNITEDTSLGYQIDRNPNRVNLLDDSVFRSNDAEETFIALPSPYSDPPSRSQSHEDSNECSIISGIDTVNVGISEEALVRDLHFEIPNHMDKGELKTKTKSRSGKKIAIKSIQPKSIEPLSDMQWKVVAVDKKRESVPKRGEKLLKYFFCITSY